MRLASDLIIVGTFWSILRLSSIPFCSNWNLIISQTSLYVWLKLKTSLKSSNLLFSNLEMSKASSITFYKWIAEFNDNLSNFSIFLNSGRSNVLSIDSIIIFRIGIMELRGVRNSWATEEKKVALFFFSTNSIYLRRVISVQTAIRWRSALIKDVFTDR